MLKMFCAFEKKNYFCTMKKILFHFLGYGVLFALVIVLSIVCAQQKKHIKDASELIEVQHEIIERLGELDAVRCNISVNLSNKTTFGNIKQSDINVIADQVMHYTRRELLKSDSICSTSFQ